MLTFQKGVFDVPPFAIDGSGFLASSSPGMISYGRMFSADKRRFKSSLPSDTIYKIHLASKTCRMYGAKSGKELVKKIFPTRSTHLQIVLRGCLRLPRLRSAHSHSSDNRFNVSCCRRVTGQEEIVRLFRLSKEHFDSDLQGQNFHVGLSDNEQRLRWRSNCLSGAKQLQEPFGHYSQASDRRLLTRRRARGHAP